MTDNPFAVLTVVVAPAILTNAASVLCLGTSNRIARVVDRTRTVSAELSQLKAGDTEYEIRIGQLERLQDRAQLLMRALRVMYAALGLFAAASLFSVVGSALSLQSYLLAYSISATLGFASGTLAVIGMVTGCVLMVRETQLALQNIAEEAQIARDRYRMGSGPARY